MSRKSSKQRKVLVVASDASQSQLACAVARAFGFASVVAERSDDAVKVAEGAEPPFDLVLIGVSEAIGAADVTRRIRQLPGSARAGIPIVGFAGSDAPRLETECLDARMSQFVSGSLSATRLMDIVTQWLPSPSGGVG